MNVLEFFSIIIFLLAGAASMSNIAAAVLLVILSFAMGLLSVQIAEVKGEYK